MRITIRFEPGLTHPLLPKANLRVPTTFHQSEDLYEYIRSSFRIKAAFGLYIEGYYIPKRQKLGEIVRNGCEVWAYREGERQVRVCQFYLAMRLPPFGVVLVPTTALSSTPVQVPSSP